MNPIKPESARAERRSRSLQRVAIPLKTWNVTSDIWMVNATFEGRSKKLVKIAAAKEWHETTGN